MQEIRRLTNHGNFCAYVLKPSVYIISSRLIFLQQLNYHIIWYSVCVFFSKKDSSFLYSPSKQGTVTFIRDGIYCPSWNSL